MALQNVRALLWRGEDLGYGSGNTRELVITSKVQASARPMIMSQGFALTANVNGYIGNENVAAYTANLRMFMNRSPDYWLTFNGMVMPANGASTVAIQIPIAPLGTLFLPNNVYGPATLTVNSSWPIPVPPTGASSATVRLASASTTVTFDYLGEQ